jgi:uncharacterized phage protein gp47/JayE
MKPIRSIARGRGLALVVFLFLGLASASSAPKDVTRHETGAVTGRVTSIDTAGQMLTIQESAGAQWVFTVNSETTFRNGDAAIHLKDLKPGWGVVVNYDQGDAGNVALLVEVEDTP